MKSIAEYVEEYRLLTGFGRMVEIINLREEWTLQGKSKSLPRELDDRAAWAASGPGYAPPVMADAARRFLALRALEPDPLQT